MRFVIDEGLPPSLARLLIERGHEAAHVGRIGLRSADDQAIWRHALGTDAIIATCDSDYAMRHRNHPPHARVLWLRYGSLRKAALKQRIAAALPDILREFRDGGMLV